MFRPNSQKLTLSRPRKIDLLISLLNAVHWISKPVISYVNKKMIERNLDFNLEEISESTQNFALKVYTYRTFKVLGFWSKSTPFSCPRANYPICNIWYVHYLPCDRIMMVVFYIDFGFLCFYNSALVYLMSLWWYSGVTH